MAIKLNKVALNVKKSDVILFNPQPNVYLKKAKEMFLGLHHSRSISLLSLRDPSQRFAIFFQSYAAIVLASTGTHVNMFESFERALRRRGNATIKRKCGQSTNYSDVINFSSIDKHEQS